MKLAVDGGSTKTISVVFDESDNEIIGIGMSGSSNYTTNNINQAKINIRNSIKAALYDTSLKLQDISSRVFAIAGIGDSKESTIKGRNLIREIVGENFTAINDGIAAYFTCNLNKDGIVFAPGTGSVGAFLRNGSMNRFGGWGWFLGDQSSATWMVKRAIQMSMINIDTESKNVIGHKLESHFNSSTRELVWLLESRKISKTDLATFAPILSKMAKKGDKFALSIFEEAANYISHILNKLLQSFNSSPKIALIGGTMMAGDFYYAMLKERINLPIEVYYGYQVVIGSLAYGDNNFDFQTRDKLIHRINSILFKKYPDLERKYSEIGGFEK